MTITNNSVSSINEALLYLQRQMAEVKTLIDNSTEVSLSELTSRVDTLQVMVRLLSTQVSDMSGIVSSLSSQVASMQTDVNSIAARMSSAESSISSLQSQVSALQTTVSNLQSTIDTLSSRMGTAESNISSLQTSVSSLNSSISILQSQMTTQNNSISALMNRVSALETWKNSYNPMPVATIYWQLPQTAEPSYLWGGTWVNVSHMWAGFFPRVLGGGNPTFGQFQAHNIPNIRGKMGAIVWNNYQNTQDGALRAIATFSGIGQTANVGTNIYGWEFNASNYNSVYSDTDGELRPYNIGVKIWYRSA